MCVTSIASDKDPVAFAECVARSLTNDIGSPPVEIFLAHIKVEGCHDRLCTLENHLPRDIVPVYALVDFRQLNVESGEEVSEMLLSLGSKVAHLTNPSSRGITITLPLLSL